MERTSLWAEGGVLCASIAFWLCSCGGDPKPGAAPLVADGASSANDGRLLDAGTLQSARATAESIDSEATQAGAAVAARDSGAASPSTEATCGDGRLDPAQELCDGESRQCRVLGFEKGTATCTAQCQWDLSDCEGVERCTDGRDNDGDGLVDCLDAADCAEQCADACLQISKLTASGQVEGTALGHSAEAGPSCTDPGNRSAVVYSVTPEISGLLDLQLSGGAGVALSVSTACGPTGVELGCSEASRHTVEVAAGETLFVTVHAGSDDTAPFALQSRLRQLACGDAIRDVGEACDDGNVADGDGCDPDCRLETYETEPDNSALSGAEPLQNNSFVAQIGPPTDEDYFRVSLTDSNSTLWVQTSDVGDGGCALGLMDTQLQLFDTNSNGNSMMLSTDSGADGLCARLIAPGLSSGDYYLRVRATPGSANPTFPYRLEVEVSRCGDSLLGLGEECDDGNGQAGDGCSSACRVER